MAAPRRRLRPLRAVPGPRKGSRSRLRRRPQLPPAGPAGDGGSRHRPGGPRGPGAGHGGGGHAGAAVRRCELLLRGRGPVDRARPRSRAGGRRGGARAGARWRGRLRDPEPAHPGATRRDHRPLPLRRVRPGRAPKPVRAIVRRGRGAGAVRLRRLHGAVQGGARKARQAAALGSPAAAPAGAAGDPPVALRPPAAALPAGRGSPRRGDRPGRLRASKRPASRSPSTSAPCAAHRWSKRVPERSFACDRRGSASGRELRVVRVAPGRQRGSAARPNPVPGLRRRHHGSVALGGAAAAGLRILVPARVGPVRLHRRPAPAPDPRPLGGSPRSDRAARAGPRRGRRRGRPDRCASPPRPRGGRPGARLPAPGRARRATRSGGGGVGGGRLLALAGAPSGSRRRDSRGGPAAAARRRGRDRRAEHGQPSGAGVRRPLAASGPAPPPGPPVGASPALPADRVRLRGGARLARPRRADRDRMAGRPRRQPSGASCACTRHFGDRRLAAAPSPPAGGRPRSRPALLLLPLAIGGAALEVGLRRSGTVYVEARLA